MGDAAERDRALSRTRALRGSITARQEIYFVDIALAQLDHVASGDAARHLHDLAQDAASRHFVNWSLEARLAEWRVLSAQGKSAAMPVRAGVEAEARRRGFNRILALIKTGAPPPI
jgi:hypothetical protein